MRISYTLNNEVLTGEVLGWEDTQDKGRLIKVTDDSCGAVLWIPARLVIVE